MTRFFCLLGLLCAVPLSSTAQILIEKSESSTGSIEIQTDDSDRGEIDFSINLSREFEQKYYVGDKVLELESGELVQSYNIEEDAGFIVGTSSSNVAKVTVNNWIRTDNGIEAAISFINTDGRHRALDVSEISAHSIDGNNRCFEIEKIGTDKTTVATHILIDRSGSMSGHMPTVIEALDRFVSIMPSKAVCQITSFNQSYDDHTNGYESCGTSTSGVSNLQAEGGTDFYSPLIAAYEELDTVQAIQKTVVIITDGLGSGPHTKGDALNAKTASTFVFWVGAYEERALEGLSDKTLDAINRIPRSIETFFSFLGEAITEQQVLLIPKDC